MSYLDLPTKEPKWARPPQCYLTKKVRRAQKVKANKLALKNADAELKKNKPLLSKKERKEILRG